MSAIDELKQIIASHKEGARFGFNEGYRAGQEDMREAAEAWVAVHYPDLPSLQDEIHSLPIKDKPE